MDLRAVILAALAPAYAATSAEFFEMRVRPVLVKNCFPCHAASRMGGLRLDSRQDILKGGNSGPALTPGKPEESLLIRAVRRTHERFKMPPQEKLKDEEIDVLTAWVAAGAIWPDAPALPSPTITKEQRAFWSFQKVRKPAPPQVRNTGWAKSPVDRFILARIEKAGLAPAPSADRRTLIRRVAFDLTGLPPAPEEVEAFVNDRSPRAFEKVVDRLLASPRYGERWGRHWLDLARYSDGRIGVSRDDPYKNAFRYRDWVIQAFNEDLPYDLFVKAQIAADLLPRNEKLLPGLAFQALGPDNNDRVDVTTRSFLGLTVACAQCHDHKYDPIPTQDYYSLLGVFQSSPAEEHPLVSSAEVAAWKKKDQEIKDKQSALSDWITHQSNELADILAAQTARYLVSAWTVLTGARTDACQAAREDSLDHQTLERWVRYLETPRKDYSFFQPWFDLMAGHPTEAQVRKLAGELEAFVLEIFAEKKAIDDRNYVKLGGAKGVKDEATRQYANLEFLSPVKFYFWRDMASEPYRRDAFNSDGGVYYYGPKDISRFLPGVWRKHLESMRGELEALRKALPEQYPFLHALKESDKPRNARIAIRGDANNLGEEAPRRFLSVLTNGDPFRNGSGRLELAEAIASPANPLTARVMANRVWQLHFGEGIARSPSNFGQLGERPTHPELLDYLAARLVENGWSIKALHREILLSSVYALSSAAVAANQEKDPENRLWWRANLRPRLDVEALRDTMLAVSGTLDETMGGPPKPLADDNRRRTVYATVARTQPDPMLSLFDFPNPNSSSEQRAVTLGPMQRLYFLNNTFVESQAKALAGRLQGASDAARIDHAYRLLFGRPPSPAETRLALDFLRQSTWPQYAQVLLSSAEFAAVP
ncbi:MAG: PSD1 domain-containing protein [Acidobacteria bacterium]|nr:PSD1 domain-containing protein [Acidobacteriota bacterium]